MNGNAFGESNPDVFIYAFLPSQGQLMIGIIAPYELNSLLRVDPIFEGSRGLGRQEGGHKRHNAL